MSILSGDTVCLLEEIPTRISWLKFRLLLLMFRFFRNYLKYNFLIVSLLGESNKFVKTEIKISSTTFRRGHFLMEKMLRESF